MEIKNDEKIRQDKISINLSITAAEVLKSDDIAATGSILKTRIRLISNPMPDEQYFSILDERCSHTTIAAESG